jgi:hypothetical protein
MEQDIEMTNAATGQAEPVQQHPINYTPHTIRIIKRDAVPDEKGEYKEEDIVTLPSKGVLRLDEKPRKRAREYDDLPYNVDEKPEFTEIIDFPPELMHTQNHPGIIVSTLASEKIPEEFWPPVFVPDSSKGVVRDDRGNIKYIKSLLEMRKKSRGMEASQKDLKLKWCNTWHCYVCEFEIHTNWFMMRTETEPTTGDEMTARMSQFRIDFLEASPANHSILRPDPFCLRASYEAGGIEVKLDLYPNRRTIRVVIEVQEAHVDGCIQRLRKYGELLFPSGIRPGPGGELNILFYNHLQFIKIVDQCDTRGITVVDDKSDRFDIWAETTPEMAFFRRDNRHYCKIEIPVKRPSDDVLAWFARQFAECCGHKLRVKDTEANRNVFLFRAYYNDMVVMISVYAHNPEMVIIESESDKLYNIVQRMIVRIDELFDNVPGKVEYNEYMHAIRTEYAAKVNRMAYWGKIKAKC